MSRETDAMFWACESADDHIRAPAKWIPEGLRNFITVPARQFCQSFCATYLENARSRGRSIISTFPAVGDDQLSQAKNSARQSKRQCDRGKLHDLLGGHGHSKSFRFSAVASVQDTCSRNRSASASHRESIPSQSTSKDAGEAEYRLIAVTHATM
jgi:hypothetical protein